MADVATLSVLLRADDQLSAKLRGAQDRIRDFGRNVGEMGRGLVALAGPLTAIGGLSVKAFVDFESGFAGIRKTVDATEEQFGELEASLRQMAMEIPVSVNELTRIGEAAGQLGVKVADIETFTRTMADLGVTTNMSSDQAATALARLANITVLPLNEVSRLGSTVVALGNNLATTEAEIVDFGLRIAGAGNLAGLTEPQLLAIGGAMSSVGIQAEAGGTAVSKVLLTMMEEVSRGGELLDVFAAVAGMSAAQFSKAFEDDAGGAFTAFVEGLGTAGTDAFAILEALGLEDQRLIRSFLSLAGAGDLLRNSIEMGTTAFAENTALTEEAEKRYQTAASQFQLLKNSVQDVAITIGATLMPPLLTLIEKVRPVLAGMGEWVSANSGLTMGLILAAGAITVVGTSLVALGLMMPGITGLVMGLTAAYGFLTSATLLSRLAMLRWIAVPLLAVAGIQSLLNQLDNLWSAIQGKDKRKETGILELLRDDLEALGQIVVDATGDLLGLDEVAAAFAEGGAASMEEEVKRLTEEILRTNEALAATPTWTKPASSAYLDLAARMEAMGRPMENLLPQAKRLADTFAIDLGDAINLLAQDRLDMLDAELRDAVKGVQALEDVAETASSAFLDLAARLQLMGRPMEDLLPLAQQLADEFGIDLSDAVNLLASRLGTELDREIADTIAALLGLKDKVEDTVLPIDELAARLKAMGRPMEDLTSLAQTLADKFGISLADAIRMLAEDRLDQLDAELRAAILLLRGVGDEADKSTESISRMNLAILQQQLGTMFGAGAMGDVRSLFGAGPLTPGEEEQARLMKIFNVGFFTGHDIQKALRSALGLGEAVAGARALPLEDIVRALREVQSKFLIEAGTVPPLALLLKELKVPEFQGGGVVPGGIGQPVPILAHGGEVVSAHGRGGQTLVINTTINGPVYGITDMEQQVAQIWRDTAMAGGFRGLL